jgi:hypothetical protein
MTGGPWFRSKGAKLQLRETPFMAQDTKTNPNEGHWEIASTCRALAVAIALALPANNLAAAAGQPPPKDYFSELGPEIHAALSKSGAKSGFGSRYFVLLESSKAADSIVRDPFNASNIAAKLGDLHKYEALCGTNVPTEVTQFREDARALQVFVQSRQAATYQRSSVESAERKFDVGGGLEVKAKADPLTAEANAEAGGGISYGRSSQDKTEASGTVTITQMSPEDRAAYEILLRRIDTSKGLVDQAYREAETKLFEVQKEIEAFPPQLRIIFDRLTAEGQMKVIDKSADTGQPPDERLIKTTYARQFVANYKRADSSDNEEAVAWFTIAAEDGDTSAQYALFQTFAWGTQDNPEAAIIWLKKVIAQDSLGNPANAFSKEFMDIGSKWLFTRDSPITGLLGDLFSSPHIKTYIWFSLAAEMGGQEVALTGRDEAAQKLSEEELAKAKTQVANLLSKAKE